MAGVVEAQPLLSRCVKAGVLDGAEEAVAANDVGVDRAAVRAAEDVVGVLRPR